MMNPQQQQPAQQLVIFHAEIWAYVVEFMRNAQVPGKDAEKHGAALFSLTRSSEATSFMANIREEAVAMQQSVGFPQKP